MGRGLQKRALPWFHGNAFVFLVVSFWMSRCGPIGKQTFLFSLFYSLSFLSLIGIIQTFPQHWSSKTQYVTIFLLAITVRLFFLSFPASNDVNRYVWEAYVSNKGFNPYLIAPDSPILTHLRNAIWNGINHKNMTACYPPLSMLFFRLTAWISPTLFSFKILIMIFEGATLFVLAFLLQIKSLQPNRLLLYALNPLVLVFLDGEAHLDSIQIFFIVLSFFFFVQKRDASAFLSLGCAIMSKYFALLFIPLVIHRENWKKSIFIAVPLLSYLPFRGTGTHLFSSLVPFTTVMHYNDSITMVTRALFGTASIWVNLFIFTICLITIFLIIHDPIKSSYSTLGCFLLLASTLHPWYITLVIPFLLLFPSRAWLYLAFATVFTFPVLHGEYYRGVFQEIQWVKFFEYIPFYLLLAWDFYKQYPFLPAHRFDPVQSISVIIPTLNESSYISQSIDSLTREKHIQEIIVADGGSSDNTPEMAKEKGTRVITSVRGRGKQIKAATDTAKGDLILVLHADCILRPDTVSRIVKTLNQKRHSPGGSTGMEYSTKSAGNFLISRLNNFRARFFGISFGDQAQFFRRDALPLFGGYPDLMIMEDIELSLRLKECGPPCFVSGGVLVSKRRWTRVGFLNNLFHVSWLSFYYLVLRRLKIIEEKDDTCFYKRYYDRTPTAPPKD